MRIAETRVVVTCPGRNYVAVKILTDEPGLYGVGDATLNGRELAVATAIEEHLAPLLVGRDPDRIEDVWQEIQRGTYWRGGPVLTTALSGIDMALWDIKGKRAGLPVYSLLGGRCRTGALAYTHASGRDAAEAAEDAAPLVERGFRAVRFQVDLPGESSFAGSESVPPTGTWEPGPYLLAVPGFLTGVRERLGEELELLHDVHGRLEPIEAARLASEVEPARLFFLEDPVRHEQRHALGLVHGRSTTPVAVGELLTSKWECLPLLAGRLVDFVRCGLSHCGGITEARKIAALAEVYGVRTAWHGPPDISPPGHAAAVHLDLAVPNFGIQETVVFDDVVHEVFPGAPTFGDGYLDVRDAPGLGTDVDEAAAARYPYRRAYLPTLRRPDGSVQDW